MAKKRKKRKRQKRVDVSSALTLEHLDDQWWRLNNLYWILDKSGNKVKFKLNVVQSILYWALWWLNIIPKSRQHGITTFICIYFLDLCLFNENVRAGIIAHRLESAKKIFRDKIKFAYDNLPSSIKSAVKVVNDRSDELLLNNNSSVFVDTSMRSGTLQYLHVSEYAYICAHAPEKAREIKRGSLETIHEGGMIFIESTSEGVGNAFHSMCEIAESIRRSGRKLTRLDFKVHFFGWHSNPENRLEPVGIEIPKEMVEYFDNLEQIFDMKLDTGQREWYFTKKNSLGIDIYKEHPSTMEEAFEATSEGTYHGPAMALARENNQIGFVPYDPYAKVFTFWDTGNIYNSIWFFQFKGERINAIDHYFDDLGQGVPHYATVLQEKRYVYGDHFAGPDIDPEHGSNSKSFHTGEKTIDVAARLGINFKIIESHSFNDRIRATNDIIKRTFFSEEKCAAGIKGLMNFRRRKNNSLSTVDRPVFFNEPVRDTIDIHIADSFGHMAVWAAERFIYGIPLGDSDEGSQKTIYEMNTESRQSRHICLSGFSNGRRKVI